MPKQPYRFTVTRTVDLDPDDRDDLKLIDDPSYFLLELFQQRTITVEKLPIDTDALTVEQSEADQVARYGSTMKPL